MFHVKYYVFLMIGIFLALGLGMLIGITLENGDVLENQQTQIARQIEDRFITLRGETDGLKEQLLVLSDQRTELETLAHLLLNETVRERLVGLNVAIVNSQGEEACQELITFIETTGAAVQSCIQLQIPSEEGESEHLTAYAFGSPASIAPALVEELIFSIFYGGATPLLTEMEELGLLRNSLTYDNPSDVILLLGSGRSTDYSPSLRYDILLIDAARSMGIPIIGVETRGTAQSYIPDYMAYGISTVDHVDSLYGKLTLVSLLTGGAGNYGYTAGVQGLLPEPLFLTPSTLHEGDMLYEERGQEE